MTAQLSVHPMTPAIGAEIAGVDLSQPLDVATADAVYRALIDHLVIFIRDQRDLAPAAQLRFAESFGEIAAGHPVYAHIEGFESVTILENRPDSPPDTNVWHTDMTFRTNPPFASILWASEMPPVGGDTCWASMYAAYDALSADMKRWLGDLSAVHEGVFARAQLRKAGATQTEDPFVHVGSAVHPVVVRHPVTGRPFLNVNRGFTTNILGMSVGDSQRLLAHLFAHIEQPEFQVRFRWRQGSLAMWDNRVTQHYAVHDYGTAPRRMHRVTVVRDRRADRQERAA